MLITEDDDNKISEYLKYVTFEAAKMKQADNFGRDHTLYVSKKEDKEAESASKKHPKRQRNPKGN